MNRPALSHPILSCQYKCAPEDFIVKECLSPSLLDALKSSNAQQKEHLWILLKKQNLNTDQVAKLLASWANIPLSDIGYSGLKDRHAITEQWFSLRRPVQNNIASLTDFAQNKLGESAQLTPIDAYWYSKKLNRGTHKTNHFQIILRQVILDPTHSKQSLENHLSALSCDGLPNYFGQQRFGLNHQNIEKAFAYFHAICTTKGKKTGHKGRLSSDSAFLVSVARSVMFNEILAQRVACSTFNRPICGDIFNLDGSKSLFCADIDETISERMRAGDIHPTAPLYGVAGKLNSTCDAKAIEDAVFLQTHFQPFTTGLLALQIEASRRPLRVLTKDLEWLWLDESTLRLQFSLTTGAFATSVIDSLSANALDMSAPSKIPQA